MDNQDSKTRFFEVLHLILKNMHEKSEGLMYSLIEHFKMYIDNIKELSKTIDAKFKVLSYVINKINEIKKEHDADWDASTMLGEELEKITYDSGILLVFSEFLSPENEKYKQNIELMIDCFSTIEYNWSDLLEDYKDYY